MTWGLQSFNFCSGPAAGLQIKVLTLQRVLSPISGQGSSGEEKSKHSPVLTEGSRLINQTYSDFGFPLRSGFNVYQKNKNEQC